MERERIIRVVIVNRPMHPFDVAVYKRAADSLDPSVGMHYEVFQPGERFINPKTGIGETADPYMPHMYITGTVGGEKELARRVKSMQAPTEAEAA